MRCVFDIETFKYAFVVVFKDIKTLEDYTFEISYRINEYEKLVNFIKQCNGLIGYNNVGFDYPVIHEMIKSKIQTSEEIHELANQVIESEYSKVPEWKTLVKQLDLYLIHHYNNVARSCSLKYLEFSLRYKKVQDLPYEVDEYLTEDMIDKLIAYCKNDVDFTYDLFLKSEKQIRFREKMTKKLKHNVINYSDVKIGERINRITYEKLSGREYKDFKHKRTFHSKFYLKDIIPKEVTFKTKVFQDFFNEIKNKSFGPDDEFDRYIHLPNITLKFAKGGLHSEDKPKIVKNTLGYLSELDIGLAHWPL